MSSDEELAEYLKWSFDAKNLSILDADFLAKNEEMTRQMRKVQGRMSSFSPNQRAEAIFQAAKAVRVNVATAAAKVDAMRRHHIDPTLPELVEALQQDVSARLDALEQVRVSKMIKQVHKLTMVRKADIQSVYDSMLDVNARLPDVHTLAVRVYEVYGNDSRYPQFFLHKPKEGWRAMLDKFKN